MPFPQRGMESALMAGIAVRVYGIPHPTKTWMVTAAVPRSLEHVAAVPLVIALAWSITAPVQVLGAEKPDERHSTQYLWPSPDGAHAEPADVGLELLIAEVTGSKPRTGEAGDLPYPSSDLITDISFGDYAK